MTSTDSSCGMKCDWWLLTCWPYRPSDLTCPWKQNAHSREQIHAQYISWHANWKRESLFISFQRLLHFALYIYGDVHDTPGIMSGQKALFGSSLLVKQHDRKSGREKKKRMCPHECDIVLLTMTTVQSGEESLETPWLFSRRTMRRGTAVLTSVTSPLSAGQILEYQ